MTDTIFALATPLGGAIAIIRISGDNTRKALSALFSAASKLRHGVQTHGTLSYQGEPLDDCMAVVFDKPHSYTGEDMAEIYIHSSSAVAQGVFEALSALGLRAAQAGEFTKRAFMNGKMDLSQAEAVCDLINASAKRQRSSAIAQLGGALSERITALEKHITDVAAMMGAILDYPDETEDLARQYHDELSEIIAALSQLIDSGLRSKIIRDGLRIAIVGKPNVGKSSLLNALIMTSRAIVTDIAGTTRDVIDASTVFENLPVTLFDTAGIRDCGDDIEREGIRRSVETYKTADVCYIALDASEPLSSQDLQIINDVSATSKTHFILGCKADKCTQTARAKFLNELNAICTRQPLFVSSKTNEGLENLKHETVCIQGLGEESDIITNTRHICALTFAKDALIAADCAPDMDCAATDVQNALRYICEITGTDVSESVITRIFENFCVGK